MLAVVVVAATLWSWARGRPLLTGVLIGLGTATKLYPLFLLGALLVICVRERRWRELTGVVLAGAATWLVVNAPAYLTGREQWQVFWTFNSERAADLGSVWLVISQASDQAFTAHTINVWSYAIFGLWCAGVALLGLTAPTTPRFAQLALLVVAGFLLVNKVYSPQYVLWLLPLAVLARPRVARPDRLAGRRGRLLRIGVVVPRRRPRRRAAARTPGFYWLAIAVRVSAELYLCIDGGARHLVAPGGPGARDRARRGRLRRCSTRSNVVAV